MPEVSDASLGPGGIVKLTHPHFCRLTQDIEGVAHWLRPAGLTTPHNSLHPNGFDDMVKQTVGHRVPVNWWAVEWTHSAHLTGHELLVTALLVAPLAAVEHLSHPNTLFIAFIRLVSPPVGINRITFPTHAREYPAFLSTAYPQFKAGNLGGPESLHAYFHFPPNKLLFFLRVWNYQVAPRTVASLQSFLPIHTLRQQDVA